MRRFELCEGTSNKFWQVSLESADLHISWGRVGTAGQAQTKSFSSAAEAQAAMEKLIGEKTKKGYGEVAADEAAAAPAPAPKAAAAAPAPKAAAPAPVVPAAAAAAAPAVAPAVASPPSGPGLELPERVAPQPACTRTPPARPSLQECLDGFAAHFKKVSWSSHTHLTDLKTGLAHMTEAYRAFAERILATSARGQPAPALEVGADAALLHAAPHELVIPYLLSRGGFGYVIRVLVQSAYLKFVSCGGVSGSWSYLEADQPTLERGGMGYQFADCIRNLLPTLSAAELAEGHAEAAKARREPLPVRLALAHALADKGWAAEDAAQLLSMKRNEYYYAIPRQVFETLRDPQLVTRLAERHPSDVPGDELLDDLGLAATPAVIAAFAHEPKNDFRAQTLARVESVAAAKALAEGLATKRSAETARQYYERRPDLAIVALSPIVARGDKLAPYVKPVLDALVRANPGLVEKLAAHLDARSRALFGSGDTAAAAPVAEAPLSALPKVLQSPPAPSKRGGALTLPAFVDSRALPKVLLADKQRALPEPAVAILLAILQSTTLTAPHAALPEVQAACDRASLAAFAWALFEMWLASGVGSKENWAFTALAHLGDDEAARRLTPLIRTWPGESQHARAALGLDVLAGIGTDLALMHLHGVAEKVKFKALQEKAREKIGAVAAARGLSTEELADRLVPELGLSADGSLTLHFGARSFRVAFDETLAPVVRDASGKTLPDLPKPGKSDDASLAAAAVEQWKTLKKDARAIALGLLTRLELAMCAQRRWKYEDFTTFLLRHPLVVHLVRRLVWGVFAGAELKQTFRVAEDGSFAGPDDEAIDLAPHLSPQARIGLCHRLELPAALLGKWGGVFADYKILQPFDQLGRQIFLATDTDKRANHLPRMHKVAVKTGKVMGLEVRGWRKGEPQDAGWVYDMLKTLPGGYVASFGLGGGLCMGAPDMNPPTQELDGLSLEKADGGKATFGELSPTVFSELVRDFEGLRE